MSQIPPVGLVYAMEQSAYDETPMACCIKDECLEPLLQEAVLGSEGRPTLQSVDGLRQTLTKGTQADVIAKVLQCRSAYGFVLSPIPNKCVIVLGEALTHLQAMSRANSDTLVECLLQTSSMPKLLQKFTTKCRSTVSDKVPYNDKAEAQIMASRRSWTNINAHCDAHCIATAFSKTMSIMENHVQGVLRTGLALQVGSHLSTFKKAIELETEMRLQLCTGVISSEAQQYKEDMIRLFHSSGVAQLRPREQCYYCLC